MNKITMRIFITSSEILLALEILSVSLIEVISLMKISGRVKDLIWNDKCTVPFIRRSTGMTQVFIGANTCVNGTDMNKEYPL